jgi:GH15 family glucan-1,4-alpha-glucosidase
VAAATLGLPERARAGRSYDYRYSWIRDGCYAGRAAARAGADGLLDRVVRWTAERLLADGPRLMPAYTVAGEPVPRERELALPGFPGGRAIAGNRVVDQFQLDGFGECLELFATAGRAGRLDGDARRAAGVAADAVAARWTEPDAGIWEIDDRRWTHSRLICVAGLRAMAADAGTPDRDAARWRELAAAIEGETARTSVHDGRWARAPADPRVDAALLLPIVRGGLPGDARANATIDAVARHLSEDGYVYRFRHGDGPLGHEEGAFLLCGFVMALAAHRRGDPVAAARWFERGRGACGPSRLFAEEWDVGQRQLRGNLPQAFVHALLLECAHVLGGLRLPGGADAGCGEPGGDGRVSSVTPSTPHAPW